MHIGGGGRRSPAARVAVAALACLLVVASRASAVEVVLGDDFHLEWDNTLSMGAAWRTEERDPRLIGKASLPENRDLCAPDDCIGLRADETEPNQRFLNARGALSSNTDDGSLNYGPWDLAAALGKWSSRMTARWKRSELELGWLAFYDVVNTGFDERHPNRIVDPGPQPGTFVRAERNARVEDDIGRALELREANVMTRFDLPGEREVELRIGRQRFPWGEAAIQVQGNVDHLNPLDANALARPGLKLFEIYKPVGMVSARSEVFRGFVVEAFYQFEWRPYSLPAKGSLISFFDAGNEPTPHETVVLPFAKTPEDPGLVGTPASPLASLVSATSFSMRRAPNDEPSDVGQYGLALRYTFSRIGERGTEIAFYFSNTHSRLPSVSATATEASCTRREGNARGADTTNAAEFLIDCGVPGVSRPGVDFEALPLDTATYFLEFPEDVRQFGFSFDSSLFGLLFQGEVAYRPNHPVQVDLEDVIFAAFQPAFPRHTIELGVASLAESRRAIPDYLTGYRGEEPGEIAPRQYIRGYERLDVLQTTVGITGLFGPSRWSGADMTAAVLELSNIWLPDRPDTHEIPLEGPGTNTHPSPGVFETGDGLKINPIETRTGYVTDVSSAYRIAVLSEYRNVLWRGLDARPVFVWSHDLHGVGPGLGENHLDDRKIAVANVTFRWRPWALSVGHTWFIGGGRHYALRDRDFLEVALYYDF